MRTGQSYALAEQQDDWTAIWYGAQKAWFYNPGQQFTVPGKGTLITPKAGTWAIPVFGGAYPTDPAVYPPGIAPRVQTPLQYTIPEGQVYVAFEKVASDYYYANEYSPDPYSGLHHMVYGEDEYYRIQLNHRFAFVRASDVEVVGP